MHKYFFILLESNLVILFGSIAPNEKVLDEGHKRSVGCKDITQDHPLIFRALPPAPELPLQEQHLSP